MVTKFSTKDQNIFFTSDTHFYHNNIIKYCNRPFSSVEEMNETIINNWNAVVGENDIVFHLGDFGFCGSKEMSTIINRLNGNIYLILGNHDRRTMKQGYVNKFKNVSQQLYISVDGQRIYLNHFPLLCFDGSYGRGNNEYTWNLFGHVHSGPRNNSGLDHKRLNILFPTQYDVGVDNNNFTPINYKQVKDIIEKQIKNNNYESNNN